jgi:ArsR family transcriptional regulator, arsenate/arsenite/antimonite-responsive transcriptional repressor
MEDQLDGAVIVLRALAHPVRLGIMQRLAAQPETCACDFTKVFAVSQPTISQHLKVLRDAGLVRTRRRGTQICYSICPGALGELASLLAGLRPELTEAAPAS